MQGPSSFQTVSELIVINTGPPSGIFVYASAAPTFQQLEISITAVGGTDSVGNPYLNFITLYTLPGGNPAIQLAPAGLFFQPTLAAPGSLADAANKIVLNSPINTGGFVSSSLSLNSAGSPLATIFGDLTLQVGGTAAGKLTAPGGASFPNQASSAIAFSQHFIVEETLSSVKYVIVANDASGLNQWYTDAGGNILANQAGSSNTPETWHTPALTNFGNNGANIVFKYRLTPEGMVELQGELSPTVAYTAGTAIATLPSGYRPASFTDLPVTCATAGGNIASFFSISTTGVLSCGNNLAAGNVIIVAGRFRLVP